MIERNSAVVEGFLDAVARRDIPAALGHLDPDVEWSAPAGLPYGGTYRGPAEVADRYFPAFLEQVDDDFELVADELIAADDRVVVRGRLRGHGRLSGRPFDVPVVQLWTIRAGKATRLEYHADTAAILDALEMLAAEGSHR